MRTVNELPSVAQREREPARRGRSRAGVAAIISGVVALLAVAASWTMAFGGSNPVPPTAPTPSSPAHEQVEDPLITRYGNKSSCSQTAAMPDPLVSRFGRSQPCP
jgi:hypothetical protein